MANISTYRWGVAPGVWLSGREWGCPDAPTVFLLHGGGQTMHSWKSAGEQLSSEGFRAIAYDARGHGESSWAPDGDYSSETLVQDLVKVIDLTRAVQPALVGASMGGGVALQAIGDGLVDASALVLVDVAHRIERRGVQRITEFMAHKPDGFKDLAEVADHIASYRPHQPRPASFNGLAKNVRRGEDGRYRWHWDPRFRARETDLDAREARLEAAANSLRLPTLLVRGGQSDVLSPEGARAFLQLCPHAEFVDIQGAEHMVAGDRNDAFTLAVTRFLSRRLRR